MTDRPGARDRAQPPGGGHPPHHGKAERGAADGAVLWGGGSKAVLRQDGLGISPLRALSVPALVMLPRQRQRNGYEPDLQLLVNLRAAEASRPLCNRKDPPHPSGAKMLLAIMAREAPGRWGGAGAPQAELDGGHRTASRDDPARPEPSPARHARGSLGLPISFDLEWDLCSHITWLLQDPLCQQLPLCPRSPGRWRQVRVTRAGDLPPGGTGGKE